MLVCGLRCVVVSFLCCSVLWCVVNHSSNPRVRMQDATRGTPSCVLANLTSSGIVSCNLRTILVHIFSFFLSTVAPWGCAIPTKMTCFPQSTPFDGAHADLFNCVIRTCSLLRFPTHKPSMFSCSDETSITGSNSLAISLAATISYGESVQSSFFDSIELGMRGDKVKVMRTQVN